MTNTALEFNDAAPATTGKWRGIFFDGPQSDQNHEGDEIPAWFVYVGDADAEPTDTVYKFHNFKAAEQLAKRASFRRTMKRVLDTTMEAGAKGIKVQLAGRLGGSEMARREKQIAGSIPLSTLRAKIDYGFVEAKTAQGHIGVQVWINQGMYEDETDGADAQTGEAPKKPKRAYKR